MPVTASLSRADAGELVSSDPLTWNDSVALRVLDSQTQNLLWEDHIDGVNEGTKNERAKHRAKAINTMLQLMSATRMPFFLKKWNLVVGRATVSQ